MKAAGFIGFMKIAPASFYYFGFPHTIKKYGLVGVITLFAIQLMFSIVLWRVHDLMDRDIFGIEELKAKLAIWSDRIREIFHFAPRREEVSRKVFVSQFLIASWQLDPAIANLCLRRNGRKGSTEDEFYIILASVSFKTLFWTIYGLLVNLGYELL